MTLEEVNKEIILGLKILNIRKKETKTMDMEEVIRLIKRFQILVNKIELNSGHKLIVLSESQTGTESEDAYIFLKCTHKNTGFVDCVGHEICDDCGEWLDTCD